MILFAAFSSWLFPWSIRVENGYLCWSSTMILHKAGANKEATNHCLLLSAFCFKLAIPLLSLSFFSGLPRSCGTSTMNFYCEMWGTSELDCTCDWWVDKFETLDGHGQTLMLENISGLPAALFDHFENIVANLQQPSIKAHVC